MTLWCLWYLSCVCDEGSVCDLAVVCDVQTVSDTSAVSNPIAVTDARSLLSRRTFLFYSDVRWTSAFFGDVVHRDVILDFFFCGRRRNTSSFWSSWSTPWTSPPNFFLNLCYFSERMQISFLNQCCFFCHIFYCVLKSQTLG